MYCYSISNCYHSHLNTCGKYLYASNNVVNNLQVIAGIIINLRSVFHWITYINGIKWSCISFKVKVKLGGYPRTAGGGGAHFRPVGHLNQ